MKVVRLSALCTGDLYPPGNKPSTNFFYRLSQPLGHSAVKRILLLLLILGSFDWLAAFHLELLQAILFIAAQLSAPVFLVTCFKYCSPGLPIAFLTDIASSRMFTRDLLCLIVCCIHEWCPFFKIFKSNLSSLPFEKLHHSLLYLSILFLIFFSGTMFQLQLRPFLHFFLGSMFLIHKEQKHGP